MKTFIMIIISAVALPLSCLAQKKADSVDLRPYLSFLRKPQGRIKEEITISTMHALLSRTDTASIARYDKDGRYTAYIDYSNSYGKEIHTFTNIHKAGSNVYTREDHAAKNAQTIILDTIRNKRGQDSVTTYRSPMGKDTITAVTRYTHDGAGQLTAKKYTVGNRLQFTDEYFYKAGRLNRITHWRNPDINKNHYNETIYSYSPDDLITSQETYELFNGKRTLINYNYYTYDKRKLITEKYCEDGRPNDTTSVTYSYGDDDLISEMCTTRDTAYMNVHYIFKAGKLSHWEAERNTQNGLYRGFLTIAMIGKKPNPPLLYDKDYTYDDHGNIIRIEERLNGELKDIIRYNYQYYP